MVQMYRQVHDAYVYTPYPHGLTPRAVKKSYVYTSISAQILTKYM